MPRSTVVGAEVLVHVASSSRNGHRQTARLRAPLVALDEAVERAG